MHAGDDYIDTDGKEYQAHSYNVYQYNSIGPAINEQICQVLKVYPTGSIQCIQLYLQNTIQR